jgi:hypothetical protein
MMNAVRILVSFLALLFATSPAFAAELPTLGTSSIALPGGPPVGTDYYAYDATNHRLWVPAGNTGNVDVLDVTSGKITPVTGFPTAPSQRPGRPNMGPSSATVADGFVWVGNRADSKLCSINSKTLEKGPCLQIAAMPDGVAFVASTKELWVTTPRNKTITIVDLRGKEPAVSGTVALEGDPEGYAVDDAHGTFYTNLEDKDRTLAIDLKTRKVSASWAPGCGEKGPRGLALDVSRRLLFVGCTDGAVTLDVGHGGSVLGRLKTGAGVDSVDYSFERKLLYVPSGQASTLTIASTMGGVLTAIATAPTAAGARAAVVDASGTAYVADSKGGRLIVVKPPTP